MEDENANLSRKNYSFEISHFLIIVFVSFLSNVIKNIVSTLIKLKNEFLWSGKPPKIKHTSMVGSYDRDGLKDIDIEKRLQALRLSWARRLYDGTEHEWKIIKKFYIEKYAKNIFYPNLKIDIKNKLPTIKVYQSLGANICW